MPSILHDDQQQDDWAIHCQAADFLKYVANGCPKTKASFPPNQPPSTRCHAEVAIRWLQELAVRSGNIQDDDDEDEEDNYKEEIDVLVRRIQTNDPKLTKLALRNTRIVDWNHPRNPQSNKERLQAPSSFRGFNQTTIQQATEALRYNHTIRSISCRYDLRFPRLLPQICDMEISSNEEEETEDPLRPTPNNIMTKLQERRFFEACVCLPRLESISLTGGNRWRISHLVTILETAKGLKHLTLRDVLVKSSSEFFALKRVLMSYPSASRRRILPLEALELTIEDQTDPDENYWTTDATVENDISPFDELLQAFAASTNIQTLVISKSILSRFGLRPICDLSTKTLLQLARCPSLQKLVLNGLSVEKGAVEAMCELLMQQNGHLRELEFSGCAFNHTVGQSGWNAMFRLIRHDPDIQIRASSLVYQKRREPSANHPNSRQNQQHTTSRVQNDWATDDRFGFIQRPREDFSFSLRDKDGADRHFRNRGLDVQYMLQEAGFFRLLYSKQHASNADLVDVMSRVTDDAIALFCILREHPSLCNNLLCVPTKTSTARRLFGTIRRRHTKRRRPSPLLPPTVPVS